jgi:flagellar biosynthesis protein FliR
MEMLTPAGATVAALLALRVSALVWTAPILSARVVPARVKSAIVVLLVLLIWPAAMAHGAGARMTAGAILGELMIGVMLGIGATLFIGAAESAGDMLAVQMGLSGANVVNPMSRTQLPVIGQFLGLFVTALILAGGGHLYIINALSTSVSLLPVGGPIDVQSGTMAAVGLGSTLLRLGLQFAAPVVASMMLGNVTLGVMARAVPQLNVLMVAFPVQIGIGLVMLATTLPLIARALTDWGDAYGVLSNGLMRALQLTAGGS